jgi:hypothetical protein
MDQDDYDFDFTKKAADYLRETSNREGISSDIGSSHAHMLVAAAFGYNSRKAMLDDPKGPSSKNQWLGREAGNIEKVREAIERMKNAPIRPDQAPVIARLIQDGLTPTCAECGEHDSRSSPLGYVQSGDDADWICPRCASDDEQYGHCRCCGDDVLYPVEELDDQGLCSEHHGEFDLDPEEEEDWESYIENIQKDG